ncbi:MAG: hypothetical protein JWP97_6476 [Labilithrix sp.]|nr:hypothetical protein [Labilithrix sp.]
MRPLLLVVDDDGRAASLLARMLHADGFEAEVALDGISALARLARDPLPDALLSDYNLPRADGLEVARFARSRSPSMPIVMVTGDPRSLARASVDAPLGAPVLVITKPLDYAELLEHLNDVLGVTVPAT